MPYGVPDDLWRRLPADEQAAIAATASAPTPTPAPTTPPPAPALAPPASTPPAPPPTPSTADPYATDALVPPGVRVPSGYLGQNVILITAPSSTQPPPTVPQNPYQPTAATPAAPTGADPTLSQPTPAPSGALPENPSRSLDSAVSGLVATELDDLHFHGQVIGNGHSPDFAGVFVIVRLSAPLHVWRYYGGRAPERGTRFVGQRAVAVPDASFNYGQAREPGNDLSMTASATIPAGTIVRLGITAPGRTSSGLWGGEPLIELVDPSDAKRVSFGPSYRLASGGDDPFGDGPLPMLPGSHGD
jgi:hypothetical protein